MRKGRGNSAMQDAVGAGLGGEREREWEEGKREFEGGNRAPGRRGTNIVGTPRAVTNDSIDARTEKLEPEENRRSFTGTEEPTCLLSSLFSFSSFLSLFPSPSTFVEPSSMASSPSRSLSPKEFRKGRSESVAADLSVMKLMPNATGGCADQHFSPRSRSSRPFLFLHWMDQVASTVIRKLRSLWTGWDSKGEKVWRGRWWSVPWVKVVEIVWN